MRCDNCGGAIDRREIERGTCEHCGAVLPFVMRAAEKAELVRRMVEQGNEVRIDGDRIEAAPTHKLDPPRPDKSLTTLFAAGSIVSVVAVVALFVASRAYAPRPSALPSPNPTPTDPAPTPVVTEPRASFVDKRSIETAPEDTTEPRHNTPPRAAPAQRGAAAVVSAHHAQYDRCQRQELTRNPAAPRRYSVAITVGPSGAAEWVEVLSEASEPLKACVDQVTRSLTFAKRGEGSTRSIVTLSFAEHP